MSHKLTMKNVMNLIISNIFLKQMITSKKIDHVDKNVKKITGEDWLMVGNFGLTQQLWNNGYTCQQSSILWPRLIGSKLASSCGLNKVQNSET